MYVNPKAYGTTGGDSHLEPNKHAWCGACLNSHAGSIEDLQGGCHAQDADEVISQQPCQQRMVRGRQPRQGLHVERHSGRVDCSHNTQALRARLLPLPLADAIGLHKLAPSSGSTGCHCPDVDGNALPLHAHLVCTKRSGKQAHHLGVAAFE